MGAIVFVDLGTPKTLTNGHPSILGRRFVGWTPSTLPFGDDAVPIGTGRRSMWVFRREFRATFAVDNIPSRPNTDGSTPLQNAEALVRHLLEGGVCDVGTEDDAGRLYIGCYLADGTTPTLEQTDPDAGLFRLTLTLAQTSQPFVCRYGGLQMG